jgi:ribonuclease HI
MPIMRWVDSILLLSPSSVLAVDSLDTSFKTRVISSQSQLTLAFDTSEVTRFTITIYIDGQSVGNERKDSARTARLAIALRPSSKSGMSSTRIFSEEIGNRTNNEAEYLALLRLLSILSSKMIGTEGNIMHSVDQVRVCSDSELLVKQMSGEYQVREERLKELRRDAKELMDKMGVVRLEWVPREENLAGLWLEGKIPGTRVRPEQLLTF